MMLLTGILYVRLMGGVRASSEIGAISISSAAVAHIAAMIELDVAAASERGFDKQVTVRSS